MKLIYVVIPNNIILNTLYKSGSLDKLINDRNIKLKFIKPYDEISLPFSEKVIINKNWFKLRIDLFFWYLNIAQIVRVKYNNEVSRNFKLRQLSFFYRFLFKFLSLPIFTSFFKIVEDFIKFDKDLINFFKRFKPDLLITPASAMDNYSYSFMVAAKSLNIPIASIVTHWDFFSKKGLRVIPDKVYVWGINMYKDAIRDNTINKKNIKILGAPHFDKYYFFSKNLKKNVVNKNKINLLFAGTSIPYDEKFQLNIIDNLITKKKLNIHIKYKPHPRAWERLSNHKTEFNNISIISKDVSIDDFEIANYDGIITPFSSMLIEFGILKKPSFIISYDDNINFWKMSEILNENHVKPILQNKWIVFCDDVKNISERFEKFLLIVNESKFGKVNYNNIKEVVYANEKPYNERLYLYLKEDFGI